MEYTFDDPLLPNEYIAITLAWDRRIESTGGTTYDGGSFLAHGVANFDLQLLTVDGTLVAQSNSADMNLEHIFFNIQDAGNYKIRVVHSPGNIGTPLASTSFGLAWWYGDASASPTPGDYDKNGSVGPEDYDVWKSNFGTSFADADGNGNGTVDAADYTVWRDNLGAGPGSGSLASVPEPITAWLMLSGVVGLVGSRRSRT